MRGDRILMKAHQCNFRNILWIHSIM